MSLDMAQEKGEEEEEFDITWDSPRFKDGNGW